jgi:hypothetical protein
VLRVLRLRSRPAAQHPTKVTIVIHLTGPAHAIGPEKRAEKPMSGVSLLLNLLWIVFGGLWMAMGWVIAALMMAVTIIGLPWAWSAITIASYTLLPFGHKVVSRSEISGRQDIGTGPLGMIGNLIWLVLAGWWLALWPIGKIVVPA